MVGNFCQSYLSQLPLHSANIYEQLLCWCFKPWGHNGEQNTKVLVLMGLFWLSPFGYHTLYSMPEGEGVKEKN